MDEYRDQLAAMLANYEQDLQQKQQLSQSEEMEAFEAYEAVDDIFDELVDKVFEIVDPFKDVEEEAAVGNNEDRSPVDTSLHLELTESDVTQASPAEEAKCDEHAEIEIPEQENEEEDEVNIEKVKQSEASTAVNKTDENSENVAADNSDDDYGPDSPGYIAPMEIEEEYAKPDLAALQASKAAHEEGDDLDLQQGNVAMIYECKLCTFQSKEALYDVFSHLEEDHGKTDCGEDELRSLVRIIIPAADKIPDPIPQHQNPETVESSASPSTNSTVEIDSSTTTNFPRSKDVTLEDLNSGNTSEDTERSTSPQITTVNTVEELQEMLSRDGSVRFIVTPELQNTEDYKHFMEDYNKQSADEN